MVVFIKRRGWDSNPRALSDKRFSRPPRYDHFDTSPTIYLSAASVSPQRQDVFYHSFLLSSILFLSFSNFSFVLNKRREWDSNPRALADKRFSRPPRYDHFDISPYIIIKPKTLCTSGVVLHSRGCLCQCKTYSIIKTFLCQQDFLFFSKIYEPFMIMS